jgi:hypothetical protein
MKKANPKIRWHLTAKEIANIKALRVKRCSLTEISKIMHVTVNTVRLALLRLGLPTRLADPEVEILALLQQNVDRKTVSRKLRCSIRSVKRVGRKHHTKRKIIRDAFKGKGAQIDAQIRERRHAIHIARQFRVPYRRVLKRAHEIHGQHKFIGGLTRIAFLSYYPQIQERVVKRATKLPSALAESSAA